MKSFTKLLFTLVYTLCIRRLYGLSLNHPPAFNYRSINTGRRVRYLWLPRPLMSSVSPDNSPSSVDQIMRITAAGAAVAMAAAEAEASSNGWDVTICISDAGGVPILVKRFENAFAASYEIAVGKAKSAALFAKKTSILEQVSNVSDGSGRAAMLSAPFILMGGGIPFKVNGVVCGAVGVSGVKPDQDEQIASAAITALDSSLSKL